MRKKAYIKKLLLASICISLLLPSGRTFAKETRKFVSNSMESSFNKIALNEKDIVDFQLPDGEFLDTNNRNFKIADGLNKINNIWYYFKNNQVDTNYTGLVKKDGAWFYVEKGVLNWNYTGLVKKDGAWFYVEKGVLNWNYTGLVKKDGAWFYVEKGVLNWSYTGLVKKDGTWFYVEKGVLNWQYSGYVKKDNVWSYVKNGVLSGNYTGLVKDLQMQEFKLMLIAGHGQGDSGAVGNGYKEADLTRDLVNRIYAVAVQKGIKVSAYDMNKNAVKQIRAGNIPNFTGNHYCLEVHFNSSAKNTSRGTMFYIHKDENGWSVEENILQRMYNLGSRKAWDGVVKASRQFPSGLLVQNNSKSQGVPHGLLETCFISSNEDVNWYLNNRDNIAQQVVEGIIEGYGLKLDGASMGYPAGTWYYAENGVVNWNFTGLINKDGVKYYVERGVVNFRFNGKVTYENQVYIVKNGVVS